MNRSRALLFSLSLSISAACEPDGSDPDVGPRPDTRRDAFMPDASSGGDAFGAPPLDAAATDAFFVRTDPEIVFFNYEGRDDSLVRDNINLQVERRADGLVYLRDTSPERYTHYYAVNGAVNRSDARGLPEGPIELNRWIHIVKFVADVSNINTEGWRTSRQYTGGTDTRFAAAYEALFYVRDGSPQAVLPHTEPLWDTTAVSNGLIFGQAPPFALTGHAYGSESTLRDESAANLAAASWNTAEDRYRLLYAADVSDLMGALGLSRPNGITSADAATLDRAADWLAARTPSSIFAVDFEPSDPAADAWMWDYADPRFTATMRALSEALWARHERRFYSWIGSGTTFRHRGVSMTLDGFTTANWEIGGLDRWLEVHQDPASISNVQTSSARLTQLGIGYTTATINPDVSAGPESWRAPLTWYLRSLDVLNLQSLVSRDERFLVFVWPYEDQPEDAKRTPMTRFAIPGQTGLIRQTDNRVSYPPNLVRDALITMLANPRVIYTNYWIFGESYNPAQALNYSRINGAQSCLSAPLGAFHVYEYEGPDTPPCPASEALYMGEDIPLVAAMVQAHEVFARHLASTLDGTQVRVELDQAPTYMRDGEPEAEASWSADTGEFARSYRHRQPWVQVWRNPTTGAHLALFQDPYAEPFERVGFRIRVAGTDHGGMANGNELTWLRW